MTNAWWAEPFLRGMDACVQKLHGYKHVYSRGTVLQSRFVVADHPQGKKDATFITEVNSAFRAPD